MKRSDTLPGYVILSICGITIRNTKRLLGLIGGSVYQLAAGASEKSVICLAAVDAQLFGKATLAFVRGEGESAAAGGIDIHWGMGIQGWRVGKGGKER